MEERRPIELPLWVHQEAIIIEANNHSHRYFNPEFLRQHGIVPLEWNCTRHGQDDDSAKITIGPSEWEMFSEELWIKARPSCDVETLMRRDDTQFPNTPKQLAKRFLASVPSLPSQKLWHYWEFSALCSNPLAWLTENALLKGVPPGISLVDASPSFQLTGGGLLLNIELRRVTIRNRDGETNLGFVFECQAARDAVLTVSQMIDECDNEPDRLALTEVTVRTLVGEGASHGDA